MKTSWHQVDESHPLIPGYTGYIPLKFYRIGTSFGNDSVSCVNAFRDMTEKKNDQKDELRTIAATTPQLPPICSNEEIIGVLDDYNYKLHPYVLGPVETKRHLLEPPIPGWTGFVPRSKVTEFGHGVRYHVMAENCYQDFKDMLDRVHAGPASKESKGESHVSKICRHSPQYQRCYRPEGMLPKYTGHIPHERSGIGKTFGNVCRSCSVCSHGDKSYGAYLAKKHKAETDQEQLKDEQ
ncbi:sperm-associated microtubule inner protein 5 [Heteronotia binoei]|uniref:sperm-associated microtubule inner protein 5 n=1 Tax=Heteronotia binoei TaxID=13085 RepID=UPI0029307F40|nr:sperm-associated microtubule inner protein 5 [Heteronotia binoei]XP_060097533.1 sperm-associated microtubule inner protein 5 [Heteronotia binoei]XP_060097534.1 sperm-associated microtubule inner protein 5 [Heteronotia binoei]XP_060097535.1 sperm-associated microtubule inner protein 5 [Heteronotia binoei]XP_060097536.1 sperm-associated microtubule inner protein 5 [Heteronotia binoei]